MDRRSEADVNPDEAGEGAGGRQRSVSVQRSAGWPHAADVQLGMGGIPTSWGPSSFTVQVRTSRGLVPMGTLAPEASATRGRIRLRWQAHRAMDRRLAALERQLQTARCANELLLSIVLATEVPH
jgi:hypothetical protein